VSGLRPGEEEAPLALSRGCPARERHGPFRLSFFSLSLALHTAVALLVLSLSAGQSLPPRREDGFQVKLMGFLPDQPPGAGEQVARVKAEERRRLVLKKGRREKARGTRARRRVRRASSIVRASQTAGPAGVRAAVAGPSGSFRYPYYLSMLERSLFEAWLYPCGVGKRGRSLRATVAFEICRDGSVRGLRLDKGSGNEMYDRAALRAVEAAAPFPPLPQGYGGDRLGTVFVCFEYRKTE